MKTTMTSILIATMVLCPSVMMAQRKLYKKYWKTIANYCESMDMVAIVPPVASLRPPLTIVSIGKGKGMKKVGSKISYFPALEYESAHAAIPNITFGKDSNFGLKLEELGSFLEAASVIGKAGVWTDVEAAFNRGSHSNVALTISADRQEVSTWEVADYIREKWSSGRQEALGDKGLRIITASLLVEEVDLVFNRKVDTDLRLGLFSLLGISGNWKADGQASYKGSDAYWCAQLSRWRPREKTVISTLPGGTEIEREGLLEISTTADRGLIDVFIEEEIE